MLIEGRVFYDRELKYNLGEGSEELLPEGFKISPIHEYITEIFVRRR